MTFRGMGLPDSSVRYPVSMAWRIEMRTSKGSPRRFSAGTLMRESAMAGAFSGGRSAAVETGGESDHDLGYRGVQNAVAHHCHRNDMLATGEADARVDLDLGRRRRKLEHGHVGDRIDFGKQMNR